MLNWSTCFGTITTAEDRSAVVRSIIFVLHTSFISSGTKTLDKGLVWYGRYVMRCTLDLKYVRGMWQAFLWNIRSTSWQVFFKTICGRSRCLLGTQLKSRLRTDCFYLCEAELKCGFQTSYVFLNVAQSSELKWSCVWVILLKRDCIDETFWYLIIFWIWFSPFLTQIWIATFNWVQKPSLAATNHFWA